MTYTSETITKLCRGCDTEKPATEFHRCKANTDGLQLRCKVCQRRKRLDTQEADRPKLAARMRSYRAKNRRTTRTAEWRYKLKARFGITATDYENMLEAQGYACAACREPEKARGGMRLAVDHCHTTGKVRGLLCNRCNMTLGRFRDSPGLLQALATYIAPHAIAEVQKAG